MNVIVANKQQGLLANIDADIIKSISGVYDAKEIVDMFKSFFYNKMILDVTALNNFKDIKSYEILVQGLQAEKIVFLLPEGSPLCTSNFLAHLISIGIYNFTTNSNGVKYLLKKSNTLKDVEHIYKMAHVEKSQETGASVTTITSATSTFERKCIVIGVRNVTESAGATTFIYLLKRELNLTFGKENVLCIEIDKKDFSLFGDKRMVSCREMDVKHLVENNKNMSVILVDLNNCHDDSFCNEVLYLIEPSTIKLNRLVRTNKTIFSRLSDKKVILNQSLLLNNDVFDFENEARIKIFYNLPPLDERKRNAIINDFLTKLGVFTKNTNTGGSGKIFGLFRR